MVTKSQLSLDLSPNEDRAVKDLLATVKNTFGDRILRAALFGSKARGDDTPASDIDLLLIVTDDSWRFRHALVEIGAEIGLKHDVLFDLRIISEARWQYLGSIKAGLFQNISQDSIPLVW